jgi:hypothetical protein
MKQPLFSIFLLTLPLIAVACSPAQSGPRPSKISPKQVSGVWCSSIDGGKTCWGIGETYSNGTEDSCGRELMQGVEFAMTLTYELKDNVMCETVVKSSHPKIMPPGEKFCSVLIDVKPDRHTYHFTDDEKVRTSYRKARSDKWCQNLIDAL